MWLYDVSLLVAGIRRIAQIFRERNVDISTQHLMRAIRLFIAEEKRTDG
jgi:acetolactate synthase small subunit